jgi:putative ABC transport system permease protein
MMLSFFERTREFGVMRAVGWGRWRIMVLVVAETLTISFFGAALGVALSFLVTSGLEHVSSLVGYLDPQYDADLLARVLHRGRHRLPRRDLPERARRADQAARGAAP